MLASSPLNASPTLNTNASGGMSTAATAIAMGIQAHTQTTGISPLTNPITTAKFLSKQDREALLQYTKHFTRKAVQIIVQSRLGDKKPTKSRVYAYNADWFNLSIKDLAQITSMTKLSLGNVESLFNSNSPFCIEISLRTPENQTMILETWCILFNEQLVDSSQKVCYNVYKKMSLVLRSLMCITRSTPTYQLSRRQSSDTYVLLYRMYCGEPIVHHLGENYATSKVGTVGTPIGSILVNLAYRTRLTMTPQNSSQANEASGGIQIKDDHFITNVAQRNLDGAASFQCRNSPTDLIYNEANASPKSPSFTEKSPRFTGSHEQLSKRSSSNLDTIVESHAQPDNKNQITTSKAINRQSSKAQPIPMQNNFQFQLTQQQPSSSLQLQRYSNELTQINDESSADENNSSSVASTPDTIYYFKLKSAAFVPSASFTNNFYGGSTSIGNLASDNDIPPFITLLSNDFPNLSDSEKQVAHFDPHHMAQSPPPPQNMLEYNFQNQQKFSQRQKKCRNDSVSNQSGNEEQMSSPCSLPNFKMLDNYNAQYFKSNNNNNLCNTNESPKNFNQIAATSMVAQQPDDFVFVESKKIAFGLSNAADDLRTFFRACENAPILDSFQNEPTLNDILIDLDQQLLNYESKVSEFDDFIKFLEAN